MVIRECFLDVALWFNDNWRCSWRARRTLSETEGRPGGWGGRLCRVFIQEAKLNRGFLAPSPASVASPLGLWPQGKCKQYNLFVTLQGFLEVVPGKVRTWEGLTEKQGLWVLDPLPPLLQAPSPPCTRRGSWRGSLQLPSPAVLPPQFLPWECRHRPQGIKKNR